MLFLLIHASPTSPYLLSSLKVKVSMRFIQCPIFQCIMSY
uniref:Uncharacterized protein n=1 Tax=Myoviridae sp. ctIty1 TaxID=2827673 RepID=A0A8S5TGG2_9CAUD|nr:MAG TPA: hypothetical protein [Myoviridae sp. ctIty1]